MTSAARGPALLTDQYELTMVSAALSGGHADRECVFEVFGRRLPGRRRFGVVAGTGRLLDALRDCTFDHEALSFLRSANILDDVALEWLAGYRFTGDIDGYPEGECYFPGSPILVVRGTFAEAVVLETLALSILNHDTAIATAAARMRIAAGTRPLVEMGSRRTHELAAVAAARAAYIAGFTSTSRSRPSLRHPHHGHRRTRVHVAAQRRAGRLRGAGRGARPGHDPPGRHLRRGRGCPNGGGGRRSTAGCGPDRLR